MAKPVRMRDKWRIRWFDENGARQSAVFDDYKVAQKELSRHLVEVRISPKAITGFGASRSPISRHRDRSEATSLSEVAGSART